MARSRSSGGLMVKVEGTAELRTALRRVGSDVQKAAAAVVQQTGRKVRDGARARAPKRSGALAKSIAARSSKKGMRSTVTASDPKAHWKEFGTVHESAKPFLFPALEAERQPYETAMKNAVDGAAKLT